MYGESNNSVGVGGGGVDKWELSIRQDIFSNIILPANSFLCFFMYVLLRRFSGGGFSLASERFAWLSSVFVFRSS